MQSLSYYHYSFFKNSLFSQSLNTKILASWIRVNWRYIFGHFTRRSADITFIAVHIRHVDSRQTCANKNMDVGIPHNIEYWMAATSKCVGIIHVILLLLLLVTCSNIHPISSTYISTLTGAYIQQFVYCYWRPDVSYRKCLEDEDWCLKLHSIVVLKTWWTFQTNTYFRSV